MAIDRRFRFGAQLSFAGSPEEWAAKARRVEDLGYATLCVSDHFDDQLAPMPALVAAAGLGVGFGLDAEQVVGIPKFAIGTVGQIADELERRRDERHEAMAPVVARLAGA